MTKVLITAFEPYDHWPSNASWLTLVEYAKSLPKSPQVTTRLYPVDVEGLRNRLAHDLQTDYDVALHLGQAPGTAGLRLEAMGLNVAVGRETFVDDYRPLEPDGPVAFRSQLPLGALASRLRKAGIPAQISYHAGTYLCNALLYLTHLLVERHRLKTRATFIHVPLDPTQVVATGEELPSLPAARSAEALRIIVDQFGQ
jgi:pyroglutamyl-peptidase